MQQVLTDIHLAEAYSTFVVADSARRLSGRNIDSLAVYYLAVFEHHKTTAEEFDQSLSWYKQHPEELDSIYVRMVPEMIKMEGVYNAQ